MFLPAFFAETISVTGDDVVLEADTSKHIVQVLRMHAGDRILLTDGKGKKAEAQILDPNKKNCNVRLQSVQFLEKPRPRLSIAVSPVKNNSRFEWFVEKAAEFGTAEIIPMICERTEKNYSKMERMTSICKSAMLQSQQSWMTEISAPRSFKEIINTADQQQKFIAHCADNEKINLAAAYDSSFESHIVLIGPEGDFTIAEIENSISHQFTAVSLGTTRLRTETAALCAAVVCRRNI